MQFQNRLATLTSVLDDNRSDLDGALTNLSGAIGEVQRFVAGSRDATAEQIQRLANVTQILVDNKMSVENVLHIAPNAFANGYNIYNPDVGDVSGAFALPNFSNPIQFVCGQSVRSRTPPPRDGKLCGQYLGPALATRAVLQLQLLPDSDQPVPGVGLHPATSSTPSPAGAGRRRDRRPPPEPPPAVSAYTGLRATCRRRRRHRRRRGGYPERPCRSRRRRSTPGRTAAGGPGGVPQMLLLRPKVRHHDARGS